MFLNSEVDESKKELSQTDKFTLREETPSTCRRGCRVGIRGSLPDMEKEKISVPAMKQTTILQSSKP